MSDEHDGAMVGIGHNGGPAFPRTRGGNHGMSLRDWFAGQALANPRTHRDDREPDFGTPDQIAEQAYAVADAMLKARAR